MKILFIGCVDSSAILLNALIENKKNIVGVITKKQSKFNSDFCSLEGICKRNNIDFAYVNSINEEKSKEFIKEKKPDIIYCFGWSQLVSKEILSIPPMGGIGFHPAALPNNRGRHPLIWALALGLSETSSSFFRMSEDADAGDIVSQVTISIPFGFDAADLYKSVMDSAKKQVIQLTDDFEKGKARFVKQDLSIGNVWRKRSFNDGIIDWRMSAVAIYNLIRALTKPYVGASFFWNNRYIRVWKSEIVLWDKDIKNIEAGKILKVLSETDYFVKAYDDVIHITDSDIVTLKDGDYLL